MGYYSALLFGPLRSQGTGYQMRDGPGKIRSWQRSDPSVKCAHLLSVHTSLCPSLHQSCIFFSIQTLFISLGHWLLGIIMLQVFQSASAFIQRSLWQPEVGSLRLCRGRILMEAFIPCTTWSKNTSTHLHSTISQLCAQQMKVFLGIYLDNKYFLCIGNLDVPGFAG